MRFDFNFFDAQQLQDLGQTAGSFSIQKGAKVFQAKSADFNKALERRDFSLWMHDFGIVNLSQNKR